ncbi:FxsA family membrane protein [Streptomyces acidiscabies]|uniref:Membrane protein n=1 Tax=Streptomyces acidiscabies TaxID=42234 RepID=A0A0L0JM06_9ACTN|nr:FxsA family membrane protein [Streptomyces acidiscabies]KND26706.1 membrane protein [Streptomyces acidiscabies]
MTGASTPTSPVRPPRSRLRTFLPLGIAAWLVLEIWLLTMVAKAASGFVVFLLLVAGIVLGAAVIKRAGRRAFRALNEALQRGGSPSETGGGNGFMMLGGLFLMLPGLISDALGLLLLIPPVQKALSAYAERTVTRRLSTTTPGTLGNAFQQARIHRPDGKVVQGEVIREDGTKPDTPRDERPPLTY